LGLGQYDWSEGFQRYKPTLTNNLYLNLILDAANNLVNVPTSLQDCWLSGKYDNGGYFYITTSDSSSVPKKSYREKSLRVFTALINRPCFTSGDNTEADHRCITVQIASILTMEDALTANKTRAIAEAVVKITVHTHIPLCFWTIPNGTQAKHRNNPTKAYQKDECKCIPSCFSVACEGGNPNKINK
jgi:hypothetical protein